MKKTVAFLLALLTLVSFASCNTVEIEGSSSVAEGVSSEVSDKDDGKSFVQSENVEKIQGYLGKEIDRSLKANAVFYELPYTLNRPASESDPDNGRLTDGLSCDIKYGQFSYVGFDGKSPVSVTFDTGESVFDVADISVGCVRISQYGIDLPQSVSVEVSDDGKKYTLISTLNTPKELEPGQKYTYYFSFPQAINARYYRVNFNNPMGDTLCIDEIMAFEYSENGTIIPDFTKRLDIYNSVSDFYNYDLNLGESDVKVSEADADYNELRNLATIDGVEFQISHWDNLYVGHENTGMERIGMLTDGVHHGEDVEQDYFKLHRGGGRHIIADLGKVMAVSGCNLSFYDRHEWGITTPPVYYISVSENGTDWVTVFAEENPDYGKAARIKDDRTCNFKQEVKARYVRLSFETVPANHVSAFVYLGEFEIMGRKNPENAVTAVYDDSIIYGNYPNPEKYGISDILFTCIGDEYGEHCTDHHVLTQQSALEYLAVLDENGNANIRFMDSLAFTTRNGINQYPERDKGYTYFLDELFYEGVNMDAADFAQAKVNADMGTNDKCKVWISVNCPIIGDTFKGKTIETAEDYIQCLKWMADEAIKRFNQKNYQNVELMGFYWAHESMRPHPTDFPGPAHDYEAAKAFNDYVHSLGYLSIWLPYYDCEGLYANKTLGFDITCLQPNLMWYATADSRITSAAEIAKLYGCGIEIEVEHSAQTRESLKFYYDYTGTGYDYGYMNSINAYYQGAIPGAYLAYRNGEGPYELEIWAETLLYVTDVLDRNYNSPKAPLDLSSFTDEEMTVVNGKLGSCNIGKLSGYEYCITQSPLYGTLTVSEFGAIEYKAMKGYKGDDYVKITVYDGISEFKTFTVKITVTE